jgi:hypothetical protein
MVIMSPAVCANGEEDPPAPVVGYSTFQQWSFSEWNYGPVNPDDGWQNAFGTPKLYVNPSSLWNSIVEGHTGVWTFTDLWGGVGIDIPNNPGPMPENDMWITLTWKAAGLSILPDRPIVGVGIQPDQEIPLGDGWMSTLFKIDFGPNPPDEWLAINGDILLDQVTVETHSVPEPATVGLLICGALLAFRRRKKY